MSEIHENENCLKDMKCPKCGSLGPFAISCRVWAVVHDDGVEEDRDHEWDDDSLCICHDGNCAFQGKVKDFRVEQAKKFCYDLRHEKPCPLPCEACEVECDPKFRKNGTQNRE